MYGRNSASKKVPKSRKPPCQKTLHANVAPGGLPGGWDNFPPVARQQISAKSWVEQCNAKRELEAVKRQQWLDASKHFKTVQLKADMYNQKPSAPRCCTPLVTNIEQHSKSTQHFHGATGMGRQPSSEEDASYHEHPPNLENSLLQPDLTNENQNASDKLMLTCNKPRTLLDESSYLKPEIAALKSRLEELKKRNTEERQKLNEELSYRAWQNSNTAVRQMESERLQHFVRSAWVDQRRWKEDEKLRRELEERRIEEAAAAIQRQQEEEEIKLSLAKQKQREEYQRELEKQLHDIKRREEEKARLEAVAESLLRERNELVALMERRESQLQSRKSRALAVSWARQHHIKLRQRALLVKQELMEDEALVQEYINLQQNYASGSAIKDDLSFVMNVIEEHKKLEALRDKEYDLLFSEEAARLWRVREQQWEREQEARDKLLLDVLKERQHQVDEKARAAAEDEDKLKHECAEANDRIARTEENLWRLDAKGQEKQDGMTKNYCLNDMTATANARVLINEQDAQSEANHRKKIARLEAEMARLWGPLYVPPHYGRKKVQW
ncbi:trichoplein keratin filament-binding protein [Hyalella azteca]|uniref:Trichoplein keratin filament-binding protein n=1 Tax=Hyalella azteca TaxID=294128 RepID=A0A8B7P424_HYAAZ|nr:trichoplein keratin filament-binding protein [Hyalella azteca]